MNQRPGWRLRRLSMRGAVLIAGVLAAGALAHTAQASSLGGTTFLTNPFPGDVVEVDCRPGSFTYHAEGLATFTHEGRFTEDGTVVFDPLTNTIISLDATFTVTSQIGGNVTGEKHYVGPGDGPETAGCDEETGEINTLSLCYRAEFADGSPPETGRSNLFLIGPFLTEQFVPDATVSCGGCPDEEDEDGDGLTDSKESRFLTLLGNDDSDFDGIADGNDDANGNGEDDEDEDDDEDDDCPDEDSDDDGEDDEDEDDDEDDDDD
jgi:hypothetical protein